MSKNELRKKCLAVRKNIPDKTIKSNEIYNEIINCSEYLDAKTIAFYYSTEDEVDTENLIAYTFLKEKTVLLPRVVGKQMVFLKVDETTKYQKS